MTDALDDRDGATEPVFMPDSNILFDVLDEDQPWSEWSSDALADCRNRGRLVVNQVICAELSVAFDRFEDVAEYIAAGEIAQLDIPWDAAFLAGRAHLAYRRRGGLRTSPLPDFFIRAHALVGGYTLITRDARRYRTYFPALQVIAPEP